jgi:hypothetical protein
MPDGNWIKLAIKSSLGARHRAAQPVKLPLSTAANAQIESVPAERRVSTARSEWWRPRCGENSVGVASADLDHQDHRGVLLRRTFNDPLMTSVGRADGSRVLELALIVLVPCAIFVGVDARRFDWGDNPLARGAAGWAAGTLLLWLIYFPAYLIYRSKAPLTGELEATRVADAVKQCPDCAESVRQAARKCRYCGFQFGEVP